MPLDGRPFFVQRVVHTFTFIVDITGQLMHFLCFNRLFLLSCSSSFLGRHWCNNIIITLPNERLIYSVSTNGGQVGKEAVVYEIGSHSLVDWIGTN